MGKVVYVDENGKPRKKTLKEAYADAKEWCAEKWELIKANKEIAITVGSVVIPAAIEIVKIGSKKSARRADERHRKLEMWDPVEGHWWKLRRELTSSELLEIERRVRNGEARGEVLYDMGVLKEKR